MSGTSKEKVVKSIYASMPDPGRDRHVRQNRFNRKISKRNFVDKVLADLAWNG